MVDYELADGVATITLNSPENRNALSRQLTTELLGAVRTALADSPRALVVSHTGPVFCAGADLKEAARARESGTPPDNSAYVETLRMLMDAPFPTIAAVNGPVRAGGIGLMAACDLPVIAADIDFALTEVRIGVAAAIISVPILRRVAPARIAAAMLTGERFSAAHAVEIGLASHAVDDVATTVTELVDGIRAGAPAAVAATKALLHRVPELDRDAAFAEMAELSARMFASAEAAEGVRAFLGKRRPAWATT